MKYKIFLDLDGVCVDFVSAVYKTMGRDDLIGTWDKGAKTISEAINVPYDKIWKKVDAQGSDFWRNLEPFPWYDKFYEELKKLAPVVFCTSPSWDAESLNGKKYWLEDRYGRDFRDFIITNQKYHVAKPNSILIDDNEKNYKEFLEEGGRPLLFPQPWNILGEYSDPSGHILNQVKLIIEG